MQTQILIGIGVIIIAIGLTWLFIWHRKNNKVKLEYSKQLWKAIDNLDEKRVRSILQTEEIDINKADKNGFSPLYTACQEGNEVIVNALLDKKGIHYPSYSLFIMSFLIKILPIKLIDKIEK